MTRGTPIVFSPPIATCPLCGRFAICTLPPALLAIQPDETTLVCHPGHGGCNTGFVPDGDPSACVAGAVRVRAAIDPDLPESIAGYTYRAWLASADLESSPEAEAAWRAQVSPWGRRDA